MMAGSGLGHGGRVTRGGRWMAGTLLVAGWGAVWMAAAQGQAGGGGMGAAGTAGTAGGAGRTGGTGVGTQTGVAGTARAGGALDGPLNEGTQAADPPAIRTTTTLVLVPAQVRSAGGALVHGLRAQDFRVMEDGVVQAARLEADPAGRQPVDLVVVLQTGGAAVGSMASYAGLGPMLEAVEDEGRSGAAPVQVAMVTFDSRPEEEWGFTSHVEDLEDGWLHPGGAGSGGDGAGAGGDAGAGRGAGASEGGTRGSDGSSGGDAPDGGAAIYDAVEHGIAMLRGRPVGHRRVLLLVSQKADEGSKARETEVVRDLGEANVAVYSLTFSPEKAWLKDQFTKPRHGNPPYQYGADGPLLLGTFNLGAPLLQALHAMRRDAAAEMATLSGGASLPFAGRREFDAAMGQVANGLANGYLLSFQPRAGERPGFHTLAVEVPARPELRVTARSGFWSRETEPQ